MGTDAVGGTVHLVTRNSLPRKGFRYGMLTTVGSFNTMAVCAYGAQRLGPVDLFAGYNRTGSDGDFPYTSSLDHKRKNRENNDYSGNQLFFKARYHFMETGRLQLLVHYTDSDRGSPGSLIYPSLDARRKEEQKVLNLQFENQLMKRIRLNAQAYVQGHANRYHAAYGNDRYDNSALGLDLVAHWIVHSNVLFTSGVEVRKDDAESSKYPLKTRNTQSLILQFEINHGLRILGLETKWKWTPAVRLDHYQAEKNHTCPKIGVLLNPFQSAGVNLRLNYGESFRLPTFNDLYYPPDEYGTHGNPLLRPETGRNLDVGVGYRTGGPGLFSVEWTYFENRFRDLILWESDADWIFSPVNVGKARISGIENEWMFRLPNGDATLSVAPTWMTGKDLTERSKNLKLIYRPEFKLDIVGGFKIIGFGINVNVRHVGMRYTRPDNSASLPAYETVNGNVQRGFSFSGIKINAKFQINNFFDKSIEITEGYPIPGRDMRFSFGLDW
jgi:outer membrane cobalamin receptor